MLKNSNPKRRKNLKLASVICTSVFSLIAVITATIAWFSFYTKNYAEGIYFQTQKLDETFVTLSVHRCITNASTDTHLKFYSQDNGTAAINLDYYSDLNTSQPILVLLKLKDGGVAPSSIRLSAVSQNPTAYEEVDLEHEGAPNYIDSFSLSSAVEFKVVPYTINDYDTSDPEVSFNFDNPIDVSEITAQSFVNVEEDENEEEHLVWSHEGNTFRLYESQNATPLLTYLAIIINYNQTAINCILNNNNLTKDLSFKCDFALTIS